jgi:hypothetical protein
MAFDVDLLHSVTALDKDRQKQKDSKLTISKRRTARFAAVDVLLKSLGP